MMLKEYECEWKNAARVHVRFLDEPEPDSDPADRIRLTIVPAEGKAQVWLMTAIEALVIIEGLTVAVRAAIDADAPLRVSEN